MTTRPFLLTLLTCAVLGADVASAQEERSPEAALRHLDQGYITRSTLFNFVGCPQDDATGRAVFEAVKDEEVDARTLVELARALAWDGAYPDCDYAPLNAWMVEAFVRLHQAGEIGAAASFARSVSPRIDEDLSSTLLVAAADESFAGEGPRSTIATAAVFNLESGKQVEAAVAAFERSMPRSWIADATRRLSRTSGAEFFRRLATEGTEVSDETMFTITGVIRHEIFDGRVDAGDDGLDLLRERLNSLPDVPPTARLPARGR